MNNLSRSQSLPEDTTANLDFWSFELQQQQQHIPSFCSPLTPTTSPSTYDTGTPLSDSYPFAAAPPAFLSSWQPSGVPYPRLPVSRSMSVSAISATEPNLSNATSTPNLPPPRQIRFVASDGQPHTKRRRITAACLTCRKRKTRCSGERPECRTCQDSAHPCAGYIDKVSRKDDGKALGDEGEEDGDSGSASPKAPQRDLDNRQHASADAKTLPKLEKRNSSRSSHLSPPMDDALADSRSPASVHTASSVSAARNRVPYFRYFGPTAIVPGFKQMVVAVKDNRRSLQSISGDSPSSAALLDSASVVGGPDRAPVEIPFYDATDPSPNAPLITNLCQLFFTNLGCNYPFLQRERFLRDLEEKKVDAILVDAVCAVSARYSSDPILAQSSDDSLLRDEKGHVRRAFRGHPFAHRAMSSVIETFPCPTIAVAQACLLLAYEEFGTDHDSGLWMYLGTAIRMAQDLGIQKLQGLQFEGRIGPTPKTAKNGEQGKEEEARRASIQHGISRFRATIDSNEAEDRRASEQERIDTFYAIFFLDRAVSSGVGRPVTLRDKDIEISFPWRGDKTLINGHPHPFPPMIRVVHMYGRVADVLNKITDVSQVTPDILKKLALMEKDLTGIYQRLDPKLHFNATNFQHYVKAEQGTNFILLHFWFHTLIILLHQPTLLHSFEGRIQQLFPDSRELSMSSAKTIADILAFAELIDFKSFVGNPFTSQPMYVAACAFLAEAAAHASQPSSRAGSPPASYPSENKHQGANHEATLAEQRAASAKHTLLASAANQNYQRCYKALKILDSYWAGCRYILTALDQKSKGLMDPLLFTSDDIDGPMPSTEPSFTSPGWRRSLPNSVSLGGPALSRLQAIQDAQGAWSPNIDWNQAIGWSLTGTANSPQPNLSFLYPSDRKRSDETTAKPDEIQPPSSPTQLSVLSKPNAQPSNTQSQPSQRDQYLSNQHFTAPPSSMMLPPQSSRVSALPYDPVSSTPPANDLLMNFSSPYSVGSNMPTGAAPTSMPNYDYSPPSQLQHMQTPQNYHQQQQQHSSYLNQNAGAPPVDYSDMLIESQDVDMTVGSNGNFAFPGGDMIPWLEYLPQDVLSYFGEAVEDGTGGDGAGGGSSAIRSSGNG